MEEFDYSGKASSLGVETVKIDRDAPGNLEEQRRLLANLFFDNEGRLVRRQEEGKTFFFHYNDEGLLEREVEVLQGENVGREKYFHYGAGRLLSERTGEKKVSYHYNSRDRLSHTSTWLGDIQESICSFHYDDAGKVILQEIREPEGRLLRSCRLKRDERGLITEEIIINQDNMILEHKFYTYPVFHGENWLKRECFHGEEGKTPVLEEVVYRNIALAASLDTSVSTEPKGQEQEDFLDEEVAGEKLPPASPLLEEKEVLFKNGCYRGTVDTLGIPQGEGEFRDRNGLVYTGGVSNGRPEGPGRLHYKDGSHYSGEFHEGLFHGEGECCWADGSFYKGSFSRGEIHGLGRFIWPDGKSFTGLFEHNHSTDQGLLEEE